MLQKLYSNNGLCKLTNCLRSPTCPVLKERFCVTLHSMTVSAGAKCLPWVEKSVHLSTNVQNIALCYVWIFYFCPLPPASDLHVNASSCLPGNTLSYFWVLMIITTSPVLDAKHARPVCVIHRSISPGDIMCCNHGNRWLIAATVAGTCIDHLLPPGALLPDSWTRMGAT